MPAPRLRNGTSTSRIDVLDAAAPPKPANSLIPLPLYYRSASLLLQQAEEYRRRGNQEQLYVMLMRFVNLVLETVPAHPKCPPPDRRDAAYRALYARCSAILQELTALKAALRLADPASLQRPSYEPSQVPGAVQLSAGHVPGLHWGQPPVTQEFDLSALENLGSPQWAAAAAAPSAPPPPPLPARPAAGMPDLSSMLVLPEASQAALDRHAILPPPPPSSTPPRKDAEAERPLYPDLGGSSAGLDARLSSMSLAPAAAAALRPPSPLDYQLQLGPQEMGVITAPHPTAPLPPGETCCTPPPPPPPDAAELALPPPAAAAGVAEVKRRQKVRNVHISAGLMDEFLRFALANTRRNVETCGILAGRLSPDDARFNVTALIVPKQEGSSDMVTALAEEEIFEAQDSRALYPLGWIHTHPSQTCFLSSIDVHTQCGYQTMLDEAIAIVMAPRDARTPVGIFRLTTPGGLGLVQRCALRGFHAHPPTDSGQPVYELSGHVYLNPRVDFEVVDLR